jgi:hypothetical protein
VGDKFFMKLCAKVVMLEFSPETLFTVIPLETDRVSQPPCNGTSTGKLCCSDCSRGGRFVVQVVVFKLDFVGFHRPLTVVHRGTTLH